MKPLAHRPLILALVLTACAASTSVPTPAGPAPVPGGNAEAIRLPMPAGERSTLARFEGPAEGAGARIADVETCEGCHMDAAAAWRSSAHAFGSFNNPVYRMSIEKLRADRGNEKSLFCGGCHDIALVVDGKLTTQVQPQDERAHAGVSCTVCHSIKATTPDGNASYVMDTSPVPIPKEGDQESILVHRARVAAAPLRTTQVCASCHRAFLDAGSGNMHHLIGQDDATPWARSAYAGSHATRIDTVQESRCQDCHMPKEDAAMGDKGAKGGRIASHAFVGGHSWLASMTRNPEALAKTKAFLQGSVTVDIPAVIKEGRRVWVADAPLSVTPGEALRFDVVVKNERVGHRFPGGVMDAQDAWLEITVKDAQGKRLFENGAAHERTGEEPGIHRFVSHMAGMDGKARWKRETHEFRANVYNHTLPPRDATVVSYDVTLPDTIAAAQLPLAITVRLLHRSRNLQLQQASCDAFKTKEGQGFADAGIKKVARALDPCKPQPITEVSRTSIELGSPRARSAAQNPGQLYDYALGLSHVLQERLEEPKEVLAQVLKSPLTEREGAQAMQLLADVLAKQGQGAEARKWLDEVDRRVPGHPATARIRAETFKPSWQWDEAAKHLTLAAESAPRDDSLWADLAVMLGGAGDHERALSATRLGLAFQPRDADMLRVQALALETLSPTGNLELRNKAKSAFLERRTPDEAPGVRNRCNLTVPGCAQERIAVHAHTLRAVR
jgi:tetratricopeptide (TPR) repeat protein